MGDKSRGEQEAERGWNVDDGAVGDGEMGASYKSMFSSRQALDLHIPMEGMPAFRGLTDCIYHWQGRGARGERRRESPRLRTLQIVLESISFVTLWILPRQVENYS